MYQGFQSHDPLPAVYMNQYTPCGTQVRLARRWVAESARVEFPTPAFCVNISCLPCCPFLRMVSFPLPSPSWTVVILDCDCGFATVVKHVFGTSMHMSCHADTCQAVACSYVQIVDSTRCHDTWTRVVCSHLVLPAPVVAAEISAGVYDPVNIANLHTEDVCI